jgi:hypothetical protein
MPASLAHGLERLLAVVAGLGSGGVTAVPYDVRGEELTNAV